MCSEELIKEIARQLGADKVIDQDGKVVYKREEQKQTAFTPKPQQLYKVSGLIKRVDDDFYSVFEKGIYAENDHKAKVFILEKYKGYDIINLKAQKW